MSSTLDLPVARFLHTLEIIAKEGRHLSYSWNRLFNQVIDVEWIDNLEQNPACAEQMEAFVSRFGRKTDTMKQIELPPNSFSLPNILVVKMTDINGMPN